MKTMAVGELKTHFSEVLDEVRRGHAIAVSYGKKKVRLAVIVPYARYRRQAKRKLGVLAGRATYRVRQDFKISDADLLVS